ncbi:MAG TPA: HAMP domain-containing sensor histidine kinase, partial [Acidimicrobiales bacterium]|nr:HAMP domain-containing sensor histidine kinase [Acidimicrobiales bacterium]
TAEPLDLRAVLDERRDVWAPVAADQGVEITVEGPTGVVVSATPDHLAGILDNLLANALEVSADGDTVTLSCRSTPGGAEAHVVDQGPGLTAEERARAFDRFWTTPSADRRLGGSGLGLPIARQLARLDGGDLELREGAGGGIDAVVRLAATAR